MNDQTQNPSPAPNPAPPLPAPVPAANPFLRAQSEHIVAGAVEVQSARAVAEAQAKLVIAQKFPRDPVKSAEAIRQACQRRGLAEEAFYTFPRGGQQVTGPSIRLAEELIRCWGNCEYGIRELSNADGQTEMEAWAWDYQTNTVSLQGFTVRHVRDTKGGGKELTDQRDIYEMGANMGARRMRARILAILPADLVDFAIQECKRTLAGRSTEPLADRIRKMVSAFAAMGVQASRIEQRLGHPLQDTTPEELVELQGLYAAIKDGQIKAPDAFAAPQATAPAAVQTAPAPAAAPAQVTTLQPPAAGAAPVRRGPGRPRKHPPAEPSHVAPMHAATAPAPVSSPAPATPAAATPAPAPAPAPAPGRIDPVEVAPGETTEDAIARQPSAAYLQPAPAEDDDGELFE